MNSSRFKNEEYSFRPIRDLKDMVNTSAELYSDRKAFLVKNAPGGTYVPITYTQLKTDVDEFGTALMDLGLTGKKIAVVGENRYEWVVTYLSVVNGVGVIVPLDRELPSQEVHNLLERAEVTAIVYSSKVDSVVEEAI
ncbi:MAG: AMP-binding protein, partial [Eubacteriales bacterium]|nr:AMP-binding protein [Eubacteriales bacterium]